LTLLAGRQPSGTGTVGPNKGAISRLRKKFRVNEGAEQCIADVALESPQALGLRSRQTKPGHLYEFALDSLEHVVNTHMGTSLELSKIRSLSCVELPKATGVPG
jgi:hypothetical protein